MGGLGTQLVIPHTERVVDHLLDPETPARPPERSVLIEIKTAGKLGYCSGVAKAIEMAIEFGDKHGKVYSLGTVAHNEDVVELLRRHGVEPISEQQLEGGMKVVITAHGAPPRTFNHLSDLRCEIQDCTCPYVRKAQQVVSRLASDGYDIVIFGDPQHQEVIGLVGWAKGQERFIGGEANLFTASQERAPLDIGRKLGIVSQTTKSPAHYVDFISMLMRRPDADFQDIRVAFTICPIVAQRIEATRKLATEVDIMLVVGSTESANTRNLQQVCLEAITRTKGMVDPGVVNLIQNEGQVAEALDLWHENYELPIVRVGVTGGTSTPIEVVDAVIRRLKELADGS